MTAKQLATGTAILADWLGDGLTPVSNEQAQYRADFCSGRITCNPCPWNKIGFTVTGAIAQAILAQMEVRNKMVARVQGDDNLGTCLRCGCHLPLKVHTPFQTILKHTNKNDFQYFPPATECWIAAEYERTKAL